jgi:hypothetical protein
MTFSHPLARDARIFTASASDGSEYRVLAIVTTLELDPKNHSYKKLLVESFPELPRNIWPIPTTRARLFS